MRKLWRPSVVYHVLRSSLDIIICETRSTLQKDYAIIRGCYVLKAVNFSDSTYEMTFTVMSSSLLGRKRRHEILDASEDRYILSRILSWITKTFAQTLQLQSHLHRIVAHSLCLRSRIGHQSSYLRLHFSSACSLSASLWSVQGAQKAPRFAPHFKPVHYHSPCNSADDLSWTYTFLSYTRLLVLSIFPKLWVTSRFNSYGFSSTSCYSPPQRYYHQVKYSLRL